MKYTIVLPITNTELYEKCINSIHPDIRKNVLIVDNRVDNIGVSAAWNIGARSVLDNNKDYLIILSQSMEFDDGMVGFINSISGDTTEAQFGWHLFAISRNILEICGLFDENFFAYYEDSDYLRRMELANLYSIFDFTKRRVVNVNASLAGDAMAIKNGININMGESANYFVRKWGCLPVYDDANERGRMYKSPFNGREI